MTNLTAARIVGTLFIVATVSFSVAVFLLDPVLGAPDYLNKVALGKLVVGAAILLELTNHIAVVGIAVVIYPVLRQFSERLAVGYLVARSIESVLFAIGTLHLAALANVSREFVTAGASSGSHFHTLGGTLLAGHDLNDAAIAFTAFSLGALILNWALYQAKLVPRWLCGWGLASSALILGTRIMVMIGIELSSTTVIILDAPIMLQEMVFAVWLIVKGFNAEVFTEGKGIGV